MIRGFVPRRTGEPRRIGRKDWHHRGPNRHDRATEVVESGRGPHRTVSFSAGLGNGDWFVAALRASPRFRSTWPPRTPSRRRLPVASNGVGAGAMRRPQVESLEMIERVASSTFGRVQGQDKEGAPLPKARKPHDRSPFVEKQELRFDMRRTWSTLEMIRMPLTAPTPGFARSTSRPPISREFSIDTLDGSDPSGND